MHRQATVYDQTSLALHPTGARAQKKHTNVVLDARGNLIARDAGGWSRVPKRGRADITEEEKGKGKQGEASEYLRMEEEEEEEEEEDVGLKDYRARKRRKAIHDHDFLGSPPPDASVPSSVGPFTSNASTIIDADLLITGPLEANPLLRGQLVH